MKASEQAIKEFIQKYCYEWTERGYEGKPILIEQMRNDLIALISEGYVPKGYFDWVMKGIRDRSIKLHDINNCYRVWVPSPYASAWILMTTDELLNYWKENVK